MLLRKLINVHIQWSMCKRFIATNTDDNVYILCKHLQIKKEKARYIQLKQPYITKMEEKDVENMVEVIQDLGFQKDILINYPSLFYMMPVTLKNRYRVLEECGFLSITPELLLSYLTLVRQRPIGELKKMGLLSSFINIENRLASLMTQWPTSLTTLIYGDVNLLTLHKLRLKIIQRYLELRLDLSKEEFHRGLTTYPTIQHRPLKAINEVLTILQAEVAIPNSKIKSNLYLIHADPDNLKKILYKIKQLAEIDVKEILRMYPKLAAKNYTILLEIQNVLKKHGISPEAQSRCFHIFTLSPKTVEERLIHAKATPEFNLYINHPRFLKMIYYNKTVLKRMTNLKNNNKKCLSLNVLSGSSIRYELFEKAPGDRLGKGKDLVFSISQVLGNKFTSRDIRNTLKRHPFWINIPLVEVKYVCDKLTQKFTVKDIFDNCPILLYPWNKIKHAIEQIENTKHEEQLYCLTGHLDLKEITDSQKLSLTLYILEKNHYFSGNGVWTEEQQKNIVTLAESKLQKQISAQSV